LKNPKEKNWATDWLTYAKRLEQMNLLSRSCEFGAGTTSEQRGSFPFLKKKDERKLS
jgi:hypothetical protein